MNDNDKWYWQDADQKPVGPFDRGALRQLFAAGMITDDTLVAKVGTDEWMPLAFAGHLNPPTAQDDHGDPLVIKLTCPGCGQGLSATPDQQGMEFQCPACGGQVVVPSITRPASVHPTELLDTEPGSGSGQGLQDTEADSNGGIATEGVRGRLDNASMDLADCVSPRVSPLVTKIVWGVTAAALVLFMIAAVRQAGKSTDKGTGRSSSDYSSTSPQRSSYLSGSTHHKMTKSEAMDLLGGYMKAWCASSNSDDYILNPLNIWESSHKVVPTYPHYYINDYSILELQQVNSPSDESQGWESSFTFEVRVAPRLTSGGSAGTKRLAGSIRSSASVTRINGLE
jgi:hypothetical protein